jgi:glyoxylase-like metal-dependent hydrolase (beta-lactamase superfamily II)
MTHPPPRVESRRLGRWQIHGIQGGGQKLDGGAMFGVVPKTLWGRRMVADGRNRIQLGMRCLLIEHEEGLVLVDTAVGNKENPRFIDIYGIENAGANGRTWLEDGLSALGMSADDVHVVILTHLHFDHAGGNTWVDAEGTIRPSFPNARYYVQRGELAHATRTNERTAASYFPRNWALLAETGQLELVDGEPEILPGVRIIRTPGHVPHHQSVLLDGGGGELACFLGDVCPTSAHLPLPWIMGYDVEPLVTLETKRSLFRRAAEERWLLVFEHDWDVPWGYVRHDGKSYTLDR